MHRREFVTAAAGMAVLTQEGERRLMVHADDAGMCHSANAATMEAMTRGQVSSTSVMVPCPWFTEFAEWARANPQLDIGIHLTLTSEWKFYRWRPVAPPEKVKGLIDPDGYIWRDVRSAASRATAEEIEIEVRAQIERAKQFGVQFTHLDTHMGTLYARPDYFEVYSKLAREYKVPCMLPRPTPEAEVEMKGYPITADMLRKKLAEGHVGLDRLVTGVPGRTFDQRRESYRKLVETLRPGVTKLIVHLAKDDPEIRAVSSNWEPRWADFQFWSSEESKSLLAEHKVRLITYRELGKLS